MKVHMALKWMHLWPPYLGAGIKVKSFSNDIFNIKVQLKMRWYNKNYVGTHFGGSLYAMTDPFYMFMYLHHLGKEFIVWDKAAAIKYIKPGVGTVSADFTVTPEEIAEIKEKALAQEKYIFDKEVEIKNDDGELVALVTKTIYVRKKNRS